MLLWVYLLGPGSVAVSLGLDFSHLKMQMTNTAIWYKLMLECDLKLLLNAAGQNSAPETDGAIRAVNGENRELQVKSRVAKYSKAPSYRSFVY